MRTTMRAALVLGLLAGSPGACRLGAAEFLPPGQTITNDLGTFAWPVMAWEREDLLSSYAQWDTFDLPFGPPTEEQNTPDAGAHNAAGAQVQQTVPGAFLTSGGNIYSPATPTAFVVNVPGAAVAADSNAYVVAQIATLGEVVDASSLALTVVGSADALQPNGSLLTEGFGIPGFGQTQTRLFYWEVVGVDPGDGFLLSFASAGTSMSLDQLVIDTLAVAPPIEGDLDGDGVVTIGDYTAWKSNLGTAGPVGDGNGDGQVNAADYTVWRDVFSLSAGAGRLPAAVPEPSAAASVLILAAAVGFVGGVDWMNRPPRAAGRGQA